MGEVGLPGAADSVVSCVVVDRCLTRPNNVSHSCVPQMRHTTVWAALALLTSVTPGALPRRYQETAATRTTYPKVPCRAKSLRAARCGRHLNVRLGQFSCGSGFARSDTSVQVAARTSSRSCLLPLVALPGPVLLNRPGTDGGAHRAVTRQALEGSHVLIVEQGYGIEPLSDLDGVRARIKAGKLGAPKIWSSSLSTSASIPARRAASKAAFSASHHR